jgi:hypothetical protein
MKKYLALAILLIIPVAVCSQLIGGYYGPAPSPYLVYDTFTGADSTALADHTPEVGGTWVVSTTYGSNQGSAQIQSNKAKNVTATAGYNVLASTAIGTPNIRIDAELVPTTEWSLITIRQDGNDFYDAIILPSGGKFRLEERHNDTVTTRGEANVATTGGVSYTITLIASGNDITARINGANELPYTSSTYNDHVMAGFGLDNIATDTASVDNFTVVNP